MVGVQPAVNHHKIDLRKPFRRLVDEPGLRILVRSGMDADGQMQFLRQPEIVVVSCVRDGQSRVERMYFQAAEVIAMVRQKRANRNAARFEEGFDPVSTRKTVGILPYGIECCPVDGQAVGMENRFGFTWIVVEFHRFDVGNDCVVDSVTIHCQKQSLDATPEKRRDADVCMAVDDHRRFPEASILTAPPPSSIHTGISAVPEALKDSKA